MELKTPLQGFKLALLTLAVGLGTFMEVLDLTIANISIPSIAGDLGVSAQQGTWVISSYAVASAISVPLTGWIAKRFGEVRIFTIAVILFSVNSLLCGLATNLPMLICFRVLQGFCSGPMIPLSQTLLLSNYPSHKKGLALAFWSMTIILAPIFGPLLGGWITENLSWPWIFHINVPIGLLVGAVTWWLLSDRESIIIKQPIDYVGLFLLVVGVASLQLVLDNGLNLDWFHSSFICFLTAVAVIALSFLIAWELTEKHPIIELSLFKHVNFRWGTIALFIAYFLFFGNNVLFPLWLQTIMNYTPSWAGLATAPAGILALIVAPIVGSTIERSNIRLLLTSGFIILGISSFLYSLLNLTVAFDNLIVPRAIQGLGSALFFVPINQIILSGLPTSQLAAATGLINFFRSLGGSFATAIMITGWEERAKYHHEILMGNITAYNPTLDQYREIVMNKLNLSAGGSYALMENMVTQQGFMLATSDIFWLTGVLFLCLIPLVWLTRPPFGNVMSKG